MRQGLLFGSRTAAYPGKSPSSAVFVSGSVWVGLCRDQHILMPEGSPQACMRDPLCAGPSLRSLSEDGYEDAADQCRKILPPLPELAWLVRLYIGPGRLKGLTLFVLSMKWFKFRVLPSSETLLYIYKAFHWYIQSLVGLNFLTPKSQQGKLSNGK